MSLPKIKIKPSEDGQYYFVVIAENGEIVAVSEMYTTKSMCKRGIDALIQAIRSEYITLEEDNG